jgi:hypothetical protein
VLTRRIDVQVVVGVDTWAHYMPMRRGQVLVLTLDGVDICLGDGADELVR